MGLGKLWVLNKCDKRGNCDVDILVKKVGILLSKKSMDGCN